MSEPYRVIVSDPPWRFGDKLPGKGRGASKHYRTMTVQQICDMELPPIAADAYLFLWRVSAMVEEAYEVCRYWGFTPKSEIVWQKLSRKSGGLHFGMGRIVRAAHETCIVASRGKPRPLNRSTRSVFDAPIGRHSEKPDRFFEIIEALCEGLRLELFARRQRSGWTCIGDEL